MKRTLGIYVHIPFCIKKCNYCDFCSFPDKLNTVGEAYVDELIRRIRSASSSARDYEVDTVYFGGGTPSLLPPNLLARILNTIHEYLDVAKNAEITLECNPATASPVSLRELFEIGFTRLSIGLQSAVDSELRLLGRAHSLSDFITCFNDARRAGFDNISVDLMYGIPEQTEQTLSFSIDLLTSLAPEHISAYGLSVEEGTDFYRRKDTLNIADDDTQATMYALINQRLKDAEYSRYEISNFARTGFESRHNLRYWRALEYLGFGVAAHSYFGGERFGNSRDIDAFLRGKDIAEEREVIVQQELRREFVMLGLRLTEGISYADYRSRFGSELDTDFPAEHFIQQGFMTKKNGHLAFTEKGFLVSNTILADIL